jgi:hypothetical protein
MIYFCIFVDHRLFLVAIEATIGGFVLGLGSAMEHVGHSCHLPKHWVHNALDALAIIGFITAGLVMIAGLIDGWRFKGLDNLEHAVAYMESYTARISLIWVVATTAFLLLMIPIWIGCGALNLASHLAGAN